MLVADGCFWAGLTEVQFVSLFEHATGMLRLNLMKTPELDGRGRGKVRHIRQVCFEARGSS